MSPHSTSLIQSVLSGRNKQRNQDADDAGQRSVLSVLTQYKRDESGGKIRYIKQSRWELAINGRGDTNGERRGE